MKNDTKGSMLLSSILVIAVTTATIFGITKWMISTHQNVVDNNAKTEAISLAYTQMEAVKRMASNKNADSVVGLEKTEYRDNNRFSVQTTVGGKGQQAQGIDASGYSIPVKVTVTDVANSKNTYTLDDTINSKKDATKLTDDFIWNGNAPSNHLDIRYNEGKNRMDYYLDGQQILKPEQPNFQSGDGYIRFKNGLILQFGTTMTDDFTFPIPFPHACYNVTLSTSLQGHPAYVWSFTNTGAKVNADGRAMSWTALGF